jgi:polar amino acid transport system substrate-binding protein
MGSHRRVAAWAVLTILIMGACSTGGGSPAPSASGAAPSAAAGTLAKIKSTGTLTVGLSSGAPIGFVDASGTPMGVTVDICNEFIKRESIKTLEVFLMPFSSEIPALQSNRIDLGCDTFYRTEERRKVVDFTDVLFFNVETIIVKKGNPKNIHKLEDLAGKSGGSYEGTVWIDWLNELNTKSNLNVTVKSYPSPTELYADVSAGRADAGIIDAVLAGYALKQNPDLDFEIVMDYAPRDKAGNAVGMPIRKESTDLRDALNKTIAGMKADGSMAKVFEKWGLVPTSLYLNP